MKILLVEDSATLRHALCSYIEQAQHKAVVAKTGEEALQLIENDSFDLIIMDVEMPGLNGFETTRLMREWFGDHWVPIIFVTGKSDDNSVCEGIEAGGDDYLTKPISQVILNAKIRAMERIVTMRNQMNALNAELEALSQRDSLTQLYNRRTFDELAAKQWSSVNRYNRPTSVLMMDVDHFKKFNDRYGHPAGDDCLQRVAQAIKSRVHRPDDIVARYGGEEFIVLLPDTDFDGAITVGNAVREAVQNLKIPHESSSTGQFVTTSVGVACSDSINGADLETLVATADKALYQAKQQGRNRVYARKEQPHKTVLIVDDDQNHLQQMSESLRNHCNIVTLETGHECVDIAHSLRPDLILLDIDMPGMDGVQVCEQLKADTKTQRIPVILISANDREKQLAKANTAGADEYMHRPIDEELLLSKVSGFLQ